LLINAIATEEKLESTEPADDLLSIEGMDRQTAFALAARGVTTAEDLAESSIDELMEVEGMDEARAGHLIMVARRPWFVES
jgi:N utilization substance protein A